MGDSLLLKSLIIGNNGLIFTHPAKLGREIVSF